MLLPCLILVALVSKVRGSVRDTGVNCVGVKSCRPRCITFQIIASSAGGQCNSSEGVFTNTDTNSTSPWDIDHMEQPVCNSDPTAWEASPIVVLASELDVMWEFSTELQLQHNGIFTLCSMSLCPKEECAVPEQMSSRIRLEVFNSHPPPTPSPNEFALILNTTIALSQQFEGGALESNHTNRYGPLHITWLDDPVSCRSGIFPLAAPYGPLVDFGWTAAVLNFKVLVAEDYYCIGEDYEPVPLPSTTSRPGAHKSVRWYRLYFENVTRSLLLSELAQFESFTREYMRVNSFFLDRLVLLDQSFPSTVPKKAGNVELITAANMTSRQDIGLHHSGNSGLQVDLEIQMSDVEAVPLFLQKEWDQYRSFLGNKGLTLFAEHEEFEAHPRGGKVSLWALIAGFETAAIVCVVVVRVVCRFHKKRFTTEVPSGNSDDHSQTEDAVTGKTEITVV